MNCAAIMTKDPLVVRADEMIAVAAERLVTHRFFSLPVVDGNRTYAGMFGIQDLLCLLVPRVALAGNVSTNLRFIGEDAGALRECFQELKPRPVGEVADRTAPTLNPDTPETEAIRLFCQNHNCLAVVQPESRSLVGVVSCWDAIRAIAGIGNH